MILQYLSKELNVKDCDLILKRATFIEMLKCNLFRRDYCLLKECSGYLSVDAVAHLDNEHTLKLLVEQQRGIVAPLLIRPNKLWSNFWGALNNGFYARSFDYMEIINNKRRYSEFTNINSLYFVLIDYDCMPVTQ